MQTRTDPGRGNAALRRGRVSLPGQAYHVTATTLKRAPVFADFQIACVAAAAFENPALLHDSGMIAWVLMPDHVHWLLQLGSDTGLSKLVAALKSASSRAASRAGGYGGRVWAPGFHDRALRSEESLVSVARYIVANPLRAGLVERIGDYPFWNAPGVWQPALEAPAENR